MRSQKDEELLAQAASRLASNNDLKILLTAHKNECITALTTANATPEQLVEANRRYTLADELENRIKRYGGRK